MCMMYVYVYVCPRPRFFYFLGHWQQLAGLAGKRKQIPIGGPLGPPSTSTSQHQGGKAGPTTNNDGCPTPDARRPKQNNAECMRARHLESCGRVVRAGAGGAGEFRIALGTYYEGVRYDGRYDARRDDGRSQQPRHRGRAHSSSKQPTGPPPARRPRTAQGQVTHVRSPCAPTVHIA